MSEIANSEGASESEKPVHIEVKFPPFPDPTDEDFDDDVSEEERSFYKNKFKDLNTVKSYKLHCTACDRHLGCSARNDRKRVHPMLRTLVCHSCHTFYNSGEFEKGDDGSELYCRWCGQGGQVYCCSDCPHVFCAKCIKRNLGALKIKEIENADDWKCFKCDPDCLKDLRAICWAVLRYCDLKQKITSKIQDPELKKTCEKDCAFDPSECCKQKPQRRISKVIETNKKKDVKKEPESKACVLLTKMPPTIQVKKFASVNMEDTPKPEKKAQKRPASPKPKSTLVKNPIAILPNAKILTQVPCPPLAKKIRLPNCNINTTLRYPTMIDRKSVNTYSRIRPKLTPIASSNYFNGFPGNMFHCSNPVNDNINLSIENLTQGLDMAAMAAMSTNNTAQQDDDVVCTPDFPLEPLCEVTEDNDDDVQCITPVAATTPKTIMNPTPIATITLPRPTPTAADITSDNIIQMSDNDVTVNESTGGLKFRVDPQTLSSNKMYRLPDGRIFAINANANMPGGYSATIVAVTEANKGMSKGATFAAKLSSVSTSTSTPKNNRNQITKLVHSKRNTRKDSKPSKKSDNSPRECDLNVPVEWYRYNLIDAVDALEYSLSRLNKLKKEATSVYLRTRSVNEMRSLHRTLERLLNTSTSRFNEIRDNLNKGLKEYTSKKVSTSEDDDDDVEILPDMDEDPIFIDENSSESNINGENQEVDLTGPCSSECNDSGENRNNSWSKSDMDPLNVSEIDRDNQGLISNATTDNNIVIDTRRKKDTGENRNKLNGIGVTKKQTDTLQLASDILKCNESLDVVSDITKESTNDEGQENKNEDDKIDTHSYESHITKACDEKKENCDDRTAVLENKTQDSEDVGDEEIPDTGDKKQDSDDKIKDNDKKHNDDKIEDVDDKTQHDDDIMHVDDEKTDFNSKITHEKTQGDDKTQDVDDKVEDTEMSEALIETLLKDDSVDNIPKNSEVPSVQVT